MSAPAVNVEELIRYDPFTGEMWWRERSPAHFTAGIRTPAEKCARWNGKLAGQPISPSDAARPVKFCGEQRERSHIAFRLATGSWPLGVIDHIDGDHSNDRILNLRDVPVAENNRNRCVPVTNTSGHLGVHWCRRAKRWLARHTDGSGRKVEVGRSTSLSEAIAMWNASPLRARFHGNHGRVRPNPELRRAPLAAEKGAEHLPLPRSAPAYLRDERARYGEPERLGGIVHGDHHHDDGSTPAAQLLASGNVSGTSSPLEQVKNCG